MKLLVNLNKQELENYLDFTNSFIIGLSGFSVNYYEATIKEIKDILSKYKNIELFISINKNIFNEDIEELEENLKILNGLKIKGILFYDLSVLEITKRLNLNFDLCIHQTHMINNYNICNYYFDKGCEYAFLSTEITLEEIKEIRENTKSKLLVYFLGHQIISHSKRKLVSNYYEHIKKDNNLKLNVIKEYGKEKKYYIYEDKVGTNILNYDILNGTKAYIELKDKIEYGILDNNLIPDDLFLSILKLYKDNLDGKLSDSELINKIEKLIGSNTGFFFQKTIYKVVKNES